MKTLIIIITLILFLGFVIVLDYLQEDEEEIKLYQGPVPEGYDEEHFRKTGETKLLENG